MLNKIIIAITLSLVLALPAHALTLVQVDNLVELLNRTELEQADMNLSQMSVGMQSPEYEAAQRILNSVTNARHSHDNLLIVAQIYTVMVDSRDRMVVGKLLRVVSRSAVKSSNRTIELCNRDLIKMQSPAAIAEVQKVRDLVQKIRDEIQRVFPGS